MEQRKSSPMSPTTTSSMTFGLLSIGLLRAGKKKKSDDEVVGIIFRNTLDGNQVCSIVLICSIYYAFYSRLHRRQALAARSCRRQLTVLYSTLVAQRRPR